MKSFVKIFIVCCFYLISQNSFAADAIEGEYEDPMGPIVTFQEDGSIKSIKAIGEAPLRFGDRSDILNAKKKAMMRGKAELAKFLKERLTTKETIDDMTKVASETTGGTDSAVRKTLEQQTETIENSADALLKGVIVLYEDVNPQEKYVKMQVGFNYKTMKAADTANRDLGRDLSDPIDDSAPKGGEVSGKNREIRKSKMSDDF